MLSTSRRPLSEFLVRRRWSVVAWLLLVLVGIEGHRPVFGQDTPLPILEERAFQQATVQAEASVVRIETVGGTDVVGETLAANGPTSGVVVGEDGWIITSTFNFLSNPTSILVTTSDGQRYPANLVAKDESRQLTLLKIAAQGLRPLKPVPPGEFKVGQWAIALGRTLDPQFPNVSVGIISALQRISGKAVQTDAKISPTNYGGALIDIEGNGMGVIVPMSPDRDEVTAGTDWYDSGIGFAVPLADVLRVLPRLQAGENLKPGKLGILYPDRGLLTGEVKIDKIRPRSPALAAGLEPGDVITGVDGTPVDRAATLKKLLGPRYDGETVTITVRRGEETLEKTLTLVGQIPPFEGGFLGLLPERQPKDAEPKAVLRGVVPGSPADEAGLKAGSVITKVGDKATADFAALRSALSLQSAGDSVAIEATQGGATNKADLILKQWPTEVPAEVPTSPVPSFDMAGDETAKKGRFVDTITGDDRRFWAYVPEQYNPAYAYGLVVWLHPESDKREAVTLERWRPVCDERGLILVAPAAGNEAWGPGDVGYVLGVIADMQKRYRIDPERTVVVGEAEGGRLALFLGLQKRDQIAGVATLNFQPPAQAPEVDPENPLRLHMSAFELHPRSASLEKSLEALRTEKFPIVVRQWPGDGDTGYTADGIAELARWIDTLDGV